MNYNFKYYILYAVLYGIILLIGEGLYRILKLKPEWSRNFSHLAVGIISLPYPWLFSSHWWVLLLAIQSSLILYITRARGLIPSHHISAGKSMGSYLFFVSIYLCFVVFSYLDKPHYFVFPILILSVSDVSASIMGRHFGRNPTGFLKQLYAKGKTFVGTLAFFLSAFAVLTGAYYYYMQTHIIYAIGIAFLISMATAITEAKSSKGYDNFSVPAITLIIMYIIDNL